MNRTFFALLPLCLVSSVLSLAASEPACWDRPSLPGGGEWENRVPVRVENGAGEPMENLFISLEIGGNEAAEKTLPLAGSRAESIRVCEAGGVEYLYELVGPNGLPLVRGEIPAGSVLVFPASVEANAEKTYYVYSGNPKCWIVPDRLEARTRVINGDFETSSPDGKSPVGWRLDPGDADHRLIYERNAESAESKKCVIRTEVATGAKPNWTGARHPAIRVEPGGKYRFTGAVQGEGINGRSGWFLHLGNGANEMIASPMAEAGSGQFDWKTVSAEFTVPADVDRIVFGTYLYGTGIARFDNAVLEKIDDNKETLSHRVTIGAAEKNRFARSLPAIFGGRPPEDLDVSRLTGNENDKNARFALIRLTNDAPARRTTAFLDLGGVARRWNHSFAEGNYDLFDDECRRLESKIRGNILFFEADLTAESVSYFILVEKAAGKKRPTAAAPTTGQNAFPGTLAQTESSSDVEVSGNESLELPSFLTAENLVKNGDMESGGAMPDDWTLGAPNGVSGKIVAPNRPGLGNRSAELSVASGAANSWPGWRQKVQNIEPGKKYFCSCLVSSDAGSAPFQFNFHQHKSDGSLSSGGMGNFGQSGAGPSDWTFMSSVFQAAPDTVSVTLHLTVSSPGVWRFDNVTLTEIETAEVAGVYGGRSGVFQIPSIIKVFPDGGISPDCPPLGPKNPARVCSARNEVEPLQIAFAPEKDGCYRIAAAAPKLADDETAALPVPTLFAVGLVPVDYPTNYYQYPDNGSPVRKIPTQSPGCDGWTGFWPDPLIPISPDGGAKFDADKFYENDSARLAAAGEAGLVEFKRGQTRALWALFDVPESAKPGRYRGEILLTENSTGEKIAAEYELTVFDFALPAEPSFGAVYDLRNISRFTRPGENSDETRRRLVNYLASKRISPDKPSVEPKIEYDAATGTASCDWTEFDAEAAWYFDELSTRWAYMPGSFYLFGWGMPPKNIDGQKPYDGEYPFAEADHSKLRPEYKKAYQARLSLFWNHLKEKGWDRHYVLYISDEPFYSRPEIIEQMKALCAMIHEVDPAIPIYASTWRHVPEWDGSIDVWGIGHYGIVPPEQLEKSRARGDSFWWTTDGQMCLDTPYCAIERLLPWWCHRWGADAYEFWGATWYTYPPFDYGWHRYIPQSDTPTNKYFVRYPNGDGYIVYPGGEIGLDGIVGSIRCEAARDGQEDAEWLGRLREALERHESDDSEIVRRARRLYDEALSMTPIPVAGGRYSTRFLSNPERIDSLRAEIGEIIPNLE